MKGKNYYHIYTKGFSDRILFQDENDYRAAMNLIPVAAGKGGVQILAFCIMSNHVHFIVFGKEDASKKFINIYKQEIGLLLKNTYEEFRGWAGVATRMDILQGWDVVKDKIIYVIRNPIAAGICDDILGYAWSSARCYYSPFPISSCTPMDTLYVRTVRHILNSHWNDVGNLYVDDSLMVVPESYIASEKVRKMFRDKDEFDVAVKTYQSYKKRMRLAEKTGIIAFPDATVSAKAKMICMQLRGNTDYDSLTYQEKITLATTLKDLFKCSNDQLVRVCHFNSAFLKGNDE